MNKLVIKNESEFKKKNKNLGLNLVLKVNSPKLACYNLIRGST